MIEELKVITEAARRYYDDKAEDYAKWDLEIHPRGFARKLQSLCSEGRPRNVIELGVGTGRWFPYVCGTGTFVGIDISTGMLEKAKAKTEVLSANGFVDVRLVEGDLMHAHSLTDLDFDLVYAIGVLGYHLPLDRRTTRVAALLLGPRGRFFVTTVQQPLSMKVRCGLKHCLAKWGLPAGHVLSSYGCSLSKDRCLAIKGGLDLAEILVFEDEPLWNGLPQCGAVFVRPVAGESSV